MIHAGQLMIMRLLLLQQQQSHDYESGRAAAGGQSGRAVARGKAGR